MFDDAYRDELIRRFGHRPDWERPEMWLVATAPERSSQRDWMNAALLALPVPGRDVADRRLKSSRNFLATYHELAVAAILQEAGFSTEYERALGRLTPDLYVTSGERALMIEVVGKFRPDHVRSDSRDWRALSQRVSQIGWPVGMIVRRPDGSQLTPPNAAIAKRIVAGLRIWLWQRGGALGMIELEGYEFHAIQELPSGSPTLLAQPDPGGWMNADDVLETIGEKVRKYADLGTELHLPLVVVLAAELNAAMSLDLVRAALSGAQSLTVTLPMSGGPDRIGPAKVQMRSHDVLKTFNPALSAVAWLTPGTDDPGNLTVLSVPSAALPHGLPLGGRIVSG